MSIAHIERLLGWDMDESNETNFRAMSSLLLGRETDLDPRAAQKAAKDKSGYTLRFVRSLAFFENSVPLTVSSLLTWAGES